MRCAIVFVVLAACSPDIVSGAYVCGPEESCPGGQVCDGVTNICVLPSQRLPFACAVGTEVEPNDGQAMAQQIAELACVSRPTEITGCAQDRDTEDWFAFDVPATCTSVGATARITFPIAYERLAVELHGSSGETLASAAVCASNKLDDGDDEQCLTKTLMPGGHYALRVLRTGDGTCAGMCAHNRYRLSVQLETP